MLTILAHYFLFIIVTILWIYVIFALVAVIGAYLATFRGIALIDRITGWFTPHFKWTEQLLPETSKRFAPIVYWVGLFAILRLLEWVTRKSPSISTL